MLKSVFHQMLHIFIYVRSTLFVNFHIFCWSTIVYFPVLCMILDYCVNFFEHNVHEAIFQFVKHYLIYKIVDGLIKTEE